MARKSCRAFRRFHGTRGTKFAATSVPDRIHLERESNKNSLAPAVLLA